MGIINNECHVIAEYNLSWDLIQHDGLTFPDLNRSSTINAWQNSNRWYGMRKNGQVENER